MTAKVLSTLGWLAFGAAVVLVILAWAGGKPDLITPSFWFLITGVFMMKARV